jgi:hypothetical protein
VDEVLLLALMPPTNGAKSRADRKAGRRLQAPLQ